MQKNKPSRDFIVVLKSVKETYELTEAQKATIEMLKSFVSTGEISECQACFTIGVLMSNGSIKSYVEALKTRKTLKREVNND